MKYLNLSLLRAGLLSMAFGLTMMAHARTLRQTQNPSPQKDTLIAVNTVPDSLLRERLARLQKTFP